MGLELRRGWGAMITLLLPFFHHTYWFSSFSSSFFPSPCSFTHFLEEIESECFSQKEENHILWVHEYENDFALLKWCSSYRFYVLQLICWSNHCEYVHFIIELNRRGYKGSSAIRPASRSFPTMLMMMENVLDCLV